MSDHTHLKALLRDNGQGLTQRDRSNAANAIDALERQRNLLRAECDILLGQRNHQRAKRRKHKARVKRLEAALRFYASESLWDYDGSPDSMTPMERDGGQIARAALTTENQTND